MILVVGATGNLGGSIARALLAEGKKVRILVRPGSSYREVVDVGAEAVTGDLKDPASLHGACAGVDAVVTTANAIGRGGEDTIESVDLHGNEKLIEAAEAEGVRRFVFTSVLGASAESPVPLIRAKGEAEQRLTQSAMTWTILQPNLFMDTWLPMAVGGPALAGQPVTLVGEGRRRHSMVAMRDVVSYAVAALERDEANNQRLLIGGPDAISWRDAVAAFEHELGREIPVHTVRPGEPVPGMPEQVNGLFQALETYDSPLDMTAMAVTYGVTPTGLDDFVHAFVSTATSSGRIGA
ncbi:MAG: SDR family oxidoreductase [Actinomycetota bacterium]|nr:SDR family oxidoreductase [Actinomycetota bacterium]MDQ3783698.1 SDR family oxidoreductase [Actinomycetota bacterium]